MQADHIRPCRPRQLCRQWRECDRCARIRQAKFADSAERAALIMITPGLMVLIPHDGTRASAERLRRWYAEKIKPAAAVWSIEFGRHGTGYHLNVIAEHVADIAPPGARVLSAPIRSTVRATAAYITKRAQAPPMTETRKRSTGYFGQIVDICATHATSIPVVKAAALQQQLQRAEPPHDEPPAAHTNTRTNYTREEFRAFSVAGLQLLRQTNERLNRAKPARLTGRITIATTATIKYNDAIT